MLVIDRKWARFEICWIILAFILITLFHYWDDLPFKAGMVIGYHDQLTHANLPAQVFWAIFHDPLNIFTTTLFFPIKNTLALSDHMFGIVPLWLPGFLITGDQVAAHNYAFISSHVISGTAAYLYFRFWKIRVPATAVQKRREVRAHL